MEGTKYYFYMYSHFSFLVRQSLFAVTLRHFAPLYPYLIQWPYFVICPHIDTKGQMQLKPTKTIVPLCLHSEYKKMICIVSLTASLFCADLSTTAVASHHFTKSLHRQLIIEHIDTPTPGCSSLAPGLCVL